MAFALSESVVRIIFRQWTQNSENALSEFQCNVQLLFFTPNFITLSHSTLAENKLGRPNRQTEIIRQQIGETQNIYRDGLKIQTTQKPFNIRAYILNLFSTFPDHFFLPFQRPQPQPICCECLGTKSSNPSGDPESLISCYGCGTSVHPSCRVYSRDLVEHFTEHGWTCDDCKTCLVCGETQKNVSYIKSQQAYSRHSYYGATDRQPLSRLQIGLLFRARCRVQIAI